MFFEPNPNIELKLVYELHVEFCIQQSRVSFSMKTLNFWLIIAGRPDISSSFYNRILNVSWINMTKQWCNHWFHHYGAISVLCVKIIMLVIYPLIQNSRQFTICNIKTTIVSWIKNEHKQLLIHLVTKIKATWDPAKKTQIDYKKKLIFFQSYELHSSRRHRYKITFKEHIFPLMFSSRWKIYAKFFV